MNWTTIMTYNDASKGDWNYAKVSLRIKNSVFIIYLLEDEQELSLGMLICLQRIYNLWSIHAILLSVLNDYGIYYTLLYYFWD